MGRSKSSPDLSSQSHSNLLLKPEPKLKISSTSNNTGKAKASKRSRTDKSKSQENGDNTERDKDRCIVNKKENLKDQEDHENKQKFGGLIFMCNAKTKPDCFRYMVMGLPEVKKELVMSIKPELKLFLYDYEARLLYGIYKASSAGGMRLEPAAFGGSFSAQVRFKVVQDCSPLPVSIFKNAIKENYDLNKNNFKTELSVNQVNNLSVLFHQHLAQPKNAPHVPVPTFLSRTILPAHDIHHLQQGVLGRIQPTPDHIRKYYAPLAAKEPRKEDDTHGQLTITEKYYQTYGLQQNSPFPTSALLPVSGPQFPVLNLYPARQDACYSYAHVATSSAHAAARLPHGNRHYCGREGDFAHGTRITSGDYRMDIQNLSSVHAGNALADYNRRLQQQSSSTDLTSLPVSSRYSFAGPTVTYR